MADQKKLQLEIEKERAELKEFPGLSKRSLKSFRLRVLGTLLAEEYAGENSLKDIHVKYS